MDVSDITEFEELEATKVSGVTDPANTPPFLLLKAVDNTGGPGVPRGPYDASNVPGFGEQGRPPGHIPAHCPCPICTRLDEGNETASMQAVVTRPVPERGKKVKKKKAKKITIGGLADVLAKAALDGSIPDPRLAERVGEVVTRYNLVVANEARGLSKSVYGTPSGAGPALESTPGQPSGLPGMPTHERQVLEVAQEVSAAQERAQTASGMLPAPASAYDQLRSVVDGSVRPVEPAAPLTTPQLDYSNNGATLKGLEKALADAPNSSVRERAGEDLTRERLRIFNEARFR